MRRSVFDDDFEPKPEVKKQLRSERLANPEQLTSFSAVGSVIEIMRDSALAAEYLQMAEPYLDFLAKQQQLTTSQAMILSLFLERYYDHHLTNEDLARSLNCRMFDLLGYQSDIDVLAKRRFLRSDGEADPSYRIPLDVLLAVRENKAYLPVVPSRLKPKELFTKLAELFVQVEKGELMPFDAWQEMKDLFSQNSHLLFVKRLDKLMLNDEEGLLLTYCCHAMVNRPYDSVSDTAIKHLFEPYSYESLLASLHDGTYSLFYKNLLDHAMTDGLIDPDSYQLTKYARQQLLSEFGSEVVCIADRHGIIAAKDIRAKQLFYNDEVTVQIARLKRLLNKDTYRDICQRLSERGLHKGVCCLFSGPSGTGKTETARQLARLTGRDIMLVDLSQVRDTYIGESERLVKGVFDRYRALCHEEDDVPILLFNEADAIFSHRNNDVHHAADQMENALQNIILQEMETFDGILIATSSMTDNLDTAFNRRFLYRVWFGQPDARARQAIWHSMMPELSEADTSALSQEYALNGGQIENVVRQATIDAILYGQSVSLDTLKGYCLQKLRHWD